MKPWLHKLLAVILDEVMYVPSSVEEEEEEAQGPVAEVVTLLEDDNQEDHS